MPLSRHLVISACKGRCKTMHCSMFLMLTAASVHETSLEHRFLNFVFVVLPAEVSCRLTPPPFWSLSPSLLFVFFLCARTFLCCLRGSLRSFVERFVCVCAFCSMLFSAFFFLFCTAVCVFAVSYPRPLASLLLWPLHKCNATARGATESVCVRTLAPQRHTCMYLDASMCGDGAQG